MGYAVTTYHSTDSSHIPVIGFDMGGTSTDVSRYDGHYDHVFENTTAGVQIQAPQVLYVAMSTYIYFSLCFAGITKLIVPAIFLLQCPLGASCGNSCN